MKKLLPLAAVALFLGAGCSTNSTATVDTNTNTNTVPTTQTQPSNSGADVNVNANVNVGDTGVNVGAVTTVNASIQGFAYAPASLTVKKGDKVVFTNNDAMPHTVTADGGAFDSGNFSADSTYTLDTSKLAAGTYTFHCTLHPNMKGTLIVQ